MWFSFSPTLSELVVSALMKQQGAPILVCSFMQNVALLKMNKDCNWKVFIMQSIHKKSWMKSSSNNLNNISWHYITKCNLGHLPLLCVHFSFSYDCQLSLKMEWFRLLFWGGWCDLLDLDFTWVVAVGGSSPRIWLLLGFLQRLSKAKALHLISFHLACN